MDNTLVLKTVGISMLFMLTSGLNDDAIMQAVCAAVGPTGFISAVRRKCVSGKYETCDIICKNAVCLMRSIYGNQGSTAGICIAAYHLYSKRNTLKNGEKGKATIAMQRFDKGCINPWCGPNFCCCKA